MSILLTIYLFGLFISSLFQKDIYHVSPSTDGPAAAVAAAAAAVVVVACVAAEKRINKRSRVEKFKLFVPKTYSFLIMPVYWTN